MKQFFKYSLLLLSFVFMSCYDNSLTPTESGLPKPFSKRYRALTTHYWRFAEKWQDTTVYGKAHPELIPLPTSKNIITYTDSCNYYRCLKYGTDGYVYDVIRSGCNFCFSCSYCMGPQPCEAQNGIWSLSNKDQSFNRPSDTAKIITLNDNVFKFCKYSVYNYTKSLVTVYVCKPHIY